MNTALLPWNACGRPGSFSVPDEMSVTTHMLPARSKTRLSGAENPSRPVSRDPVGPPAA